MADTPADLLYRWVLSMAGPSSDWFSEQIAHLRAKKLAARRELHMFLGFAPRKLGKADLALNADELAQADAARAGWSPEGWSVDGAARVLALLEYRSNQSFAETFKDLRRTADVAELVALYRGLPLYPEPESLDFEVGEGLRSNLKPVFEAIAHNNPYPRDHFDEHRWNHMILKALFVDSALGPITGLEERANPELARILVDYAEERWAAGRPVTEELWIPVRPFQDDPKIRAALKRAKAAGHLEKETV